MEKIFDLEVEKYLRDAGVSKKEIATIKFKSLKKLACERLHYVATLLDLDDYEGIRKLTTSSPSGDSMGCGNKINGYSQFSRNVI